MRSLALMPHSLCIMERRLSRTITGPSESNRNGRSSAPDTTLKRALTQSKDVQDAVAVREHDAGGVSEAQPQVRVPLQ